MLKEGSEKSATARKNIFISYRVNDTAGETGRLVDSLKQYVDDDQIFIDIDQLEPGADFAEVIKKHLDFCDVMLAVIGPNWIGRKQDGSTLITEEDDWVRLELSKALARGIRVVPVLVNNATLPTAKELPEDLQPLLKRNTYSISFNRWKYDTDNLALFLIKSIGITPKATPVKKKWWAAISSKRYVVYIFKLLVILVILSFIDSFNYRVLTTNRDPATEYQKKVVWSYFWGLVNGPPQIQVPNCTHANALDEIVLSKKFDQSLLTFVTLGAVSPIEIKWKCHKPCPRIEEVNK